jgi:hypothetical protein
VSIHNTRLVFQQQTGLNDNQSQKNPLEDIPIGDYSKNCLKLFNFINPKPLAMEPAPGSVVTSREWQKQGKRIKKHFSR